MPMPCVLLGSAAARGQGSDDPATATFIPGSPFRDGGTTIGCTDDSDELCPSAGSTSADAYDVCEAPIDGLISPCA
jgi:hypothetical protein